MFQLVLELSLDHVIC